MERSIPADVERFAHELTAVSAIGTGDELLRLFDPILLLGSQTEAADGDGLGHGL